VAVAVAGNSSASNKSADVIRFFIFVSVFILGFNCIVAAKLRIKMSLDKSPNHQLPFLVNSSTVGPRLGVAAHDCNIFQTT
jgi:hypothetical protein